MRTNKRRAIVKSLGVGVLSTLSGCTLMGGDGPNPIQVILDNNHTTEHTIAATVTNHDGETVLERSETVGAGSDTDLGTFTPSSSENKLTYTIHAEVDSNLSDSLAFPVGGSSGTNSVFVEVTEDGELELNRAYE